MAIVKEIIHDACKIHICDDYIKTDPEEIRKALENIALIARTGLQAKQKEKEKASA